MRLIDNLRASRHGTQEFVAPTTVELRTRREELRARVAELQYDLGGLTYEMAVRDHFRPDVLARRAALLQTADAELGEVERLLRNEETATTGTCRSCGAVHSRAAAFCWQCGAELLATTAI
ncbi:MAG: hypothetical protein NVSMB51_15730 [Solirubrobacteraceae bacterium]